MVVYCLNHLFLGRHPTLKELGRRPNKIQMRCFQRLRSLIDVSGDARESFSMIPGRSGPELAELLLQLENFVEKQPDLRQSYAQSKPVPFQPDSSLVDGEEHPELHPYKNLCVDRLRLVG